MLAYPITCLRTTTGPCWPPLTDFPELTTFGDDREEAIARAVHALEEAIAARIHDRKDIPSTVSGADLRHNADSHLGEGNALPGDEGPGRRQGGVGPSPWVAHAGKWIVCWTFSTGRG